MHVINPVRVSRTYCQKLNAPPSVVFPLLCPVRETEWVPGWAPVAIFTRSGYAEPDCVFITGEEETEPETIWVITERDEVAFRLEMIKVTPGMTVGRIRIALEPDGEMGSIATVTYSYTAMSADGERFIYAYSEEFFKEFMQAWETSMNEHLAGCEPILA